MTIQEIKDLFPAEHKGTASISDLEILFIKMGLDVTYIKELQMDSRPMLVATIFKQILKVAGGENLFPEEVQGQITITDLARVAVKFGSDYTPVGDEVLPVI